MDFELTADQQALAEGVRALLDGRFPLDRLRRSEGARRVTDSGSWRALGEAGVFALTLPEEQGGVGLGVADEAVVFEELGRALVPGPLVACALAAGSVPGVAEGEVLVTCAEGAEPARPALVEHLEGAAALLSVPGPWRSPLPVSLVTLHGTALEAVPLDRPLDPLTPVWRLSAPVPAGTPVATGDLATTWWLRGVVLSAALQVGHAAAVVDLAVAYAKERSQFGRPIGSFQAVKHLCADMLVRAEVARCAVHAAACLVDQPEAAAVEAATTGLVPEDVAVRAAAGAKALADEAAVGNVRAAIQVHGGMGFTWEVPLHLHLKRALVRATTFGTAHDHQATVADLAAAATEEAL